MWRINNFHRFELGWFDLSRDGRIDLNAPLTIGSVTFPAGATLVTDFDTSVLKVGYAFSLFHDEQKELSVFGGIHFSDVSFRTSDGSQEVSTSTKPLLPAIGAKFNASLTGKFVVGANLDYYNMDFNKNSGSMINFAFFGEYRFVEKISAGLGYRIYNQKISSGDPEFSGDYEFDYRGPTIYLTGRF